MLKKIFALCAAGSLLIGAAAVAADKAEAEKAIAEAKEAKAAASAAKGEWRDTGDWLKDAEAALGTEKYDEAVQLANDAKFQYEAGAAQMTAQTDVGNPSYIK